MAVKSTKYVLKEIESIVGFSLIDGSHEFTLEDNQQITFDNTAETLNATGKNGSILAQWDTNKQATISGNNGTITEGLLAVQTGSEVETLTNFTGATISEVVSTADGKKALTAHTAQGNAGNEIGYIYIREEDGSLGAKYEQTAAADATHFSYDPSTKTISLPVDGSNPVISAGSTVALFYQPMISSAKRIHNESGQFSKSVRLVANAFFRDICTQKDYVGQIIFSKAKASGAFQWVFGDNPAVHAFSFSSLTGCGNGGLWDVIIFDEDDIVDSSTI